MFKNNVLLDSLVSFPITKKCISAEVYNPLCGSTSRIAAKQRELTAGIALSKCQLRNSTEDDLRRLSLLDSYNTGHRAGLSHHCLYVEHKLATLTAPVRYSSHSLA